MSWLSQNWIWILLALGMVFMMRRGGMGCGMGHAHTDKKTVAPAQAGSQPAESAQQHRHRGCC